MLWVYSLEPPERWGWGWGGVSLLIMRYENQIGKKPPKKRKNIGTVIKACKYGKSSDYSCI